MCRVAGCVKEQILWIERFDTLEELRARIRAFARDFNERWLLERHSYRTLFRGLRAAQSGRRGMIAVFTIKCPVNRVRRTSGIACALHHAHHDDVSLPDGKAGYRIGLILHPPRDVSEGVEQLCGWAGNHRTTVLVGVGDLPRVAAGVEPATDDELRGCDPLVSLGGDGTMLGAMWLVADRPIPVLGVNFGTLGFLVEIQPPELPAALSRIAAGEATLELRGALRVTAGDTEVIAFNEVAIVRFPGEGFVHANLEVDGTRYGYYRADALIIATPIGLDRLLVCGRRPCTVTGCRGDRHHPGITDERNQPSAGAVP